MSDWNHKTHPQGTRNTRRTLRVALIGIVALVLVLVPLQLHIVPDATSPYATVSLTPSYTHAQEEEAFDPTTFATGQRSGGVNSNTLNCGVTNVFSQNGFVGCMAVGVDTLLGFFGWLLGGAGVVLNFAVVETVLEMGKNVDQVGAIEEGWRVFRDLANIVLIFTLLAIGVATILQVEGYGIKQLLPKLIVVALLINFSLFFTQVIIDTGNLLAAQFYGQFEKCTPTTGTIGSIDATYTTDGTCSSFSEQIVDTLDLATLYNVNLNPGGTGAANLIASGLKPEDIIIIGLMGIALFLVTTFVFLAAALLLITRFAVLILLMVLAPLAFVFMILPFTSGYARRWWSSLFNQTIFAPAFFILMWFALQVVTSDGFRGSIGVGEATALSATVGERVDISAFAVFLNFFIVIVFVVAALLIAKQFSIVGADTMIRWGDNLRKYGQGAVTRGGGAVTAGLTGYAYQQTVGRAASRLERSEGFQRFAGRTRTGEALMRGTRGLARASGDIRAAPVARDVAGVLGLGAAVGQGGFEARQQRRAERRAEFGRSLDRSGQGRAGYAQRLARGPLTRGGSQMSARTLLGTLGRHNRLAAARLLRDRVNELTAEINQLTNEQRNLEQITTRSPVQDARLAEIPFEIEDRANERTNLQNQINLLGLQDTVQQGY